MNPIDKQTHYDLLHRIELNDRRFRTAQTVFMSIVGLILVGLVAAQFVVIQNLQKQSAERAEAIKTISQDNQKISKENNLLSQKTNRYIQCVAKFFATPEQGKVLTDLDKCTFEDAATTSSPGIIATPPPASSTPSSGSGSPGPAAQPGSSPQGQANETQEAKPIQVLGIPVCVPFTNICARQ